MNLPAASQHTATGHAAHFTKLDQLLTRHATLWQIKPFHHRQLCWTQSHPTLCDALLNLDENGLQALEADQVGLAQWLTPWLGDDAQEIISLTKLARLAQRKFPTPPRFDTGIPGRKWQQILAFAGSLPQENRALLEWCAGKGHLGRLLSVTDNRPVTSLEWRQDLCQAGLCEAQRVGAKVRFVQADVLSPNSQRYLFSGGHAVALHACGDLHRILAKYWAAGASTRLSLSPCCYHLTRNECYGPLSRAAQKSALRLSKLDLHLAIEEIVTGGRGVERKRHTEVLWRLAFDEWQREARGVDHYLNVPVFPKSLLSGDFATFQRWAAQKKSLAHLKCLDPATWLAKGEARVHLVRRMELISHFFRRALELWLALDIALFLEGSGAQVQLGIFCEKSLTPRNIIIDARKVG